MSLGTPRVHPLDLAWAAEIEAFCLRSTAELAPQMRHGSQLDHTLFATYQQDLGLVRYALGYALTEVHWNLRMAARALLRVFELRGATAEGVEGSADASLTNSRQGRNALHLALAVGDGDLARAIAALVGDPEGASYLGPGSVVTTADEQALAYAWRDLLLGRPVPAVVLSEEASPGERHEAAALAALAAGDAAACIAALRRLLAWHAEEAGREEHRHQPDWLLCLPGLALAALAAERGLVRLADLAVESPYLPVELPELPAKAGDPDSGPDITPDIE